MKDVATSPFHPSPQTDLKFYRCVNGILRAAALTGATMKRQSPHFHSQVALALNPAARAH